MISLLRTKVGDILPYPMGAPETPELRKGRRILILALAIAGLCAAAFKPLLALTGIGVVSVLIGALIVLAIQAPLYVRAKLKADDDWLALCIARNREEEGRVL